MVSPKNIQRFSIGCPCSFFPSTVIIPMNAFGMLSRSNYGISHANVLRSRSSAIRTSSLHGFEASSSKHLLSQKLTPIRVSFFIRQSEWCKHEFVYRSFVIGHQYVFPHFFFSHECVLGEFTVAAEDMSQCLFDFATKWIL
jgi:hypothetical protein